MRWKEDIPDAPWIGMCREDWEDYLKRASPWYDPEDDIDYEEEEDDEHDDEEA